MKTFFLFLLLIVSSSAYSFETHSKPLLRPIKKPEVILIDPGHGGDDYGTQSLTHPPLLEKRLTLHTAYLLRSALESYGYSTLMTRWKDQSVSLDERISFSKLTNPTIFVSIHFNSAPSIEAEGIEVFFHKDENPTKTKDSEALAKSILHRCLEWTGAVNRKTKSGIYRVIKDTEMPAVLIEGGFLTHSKEAKKIGTPLYLKKLAMGIAKGIDDFLTHQRSTKRKAVRHLNRLPS